MTPSLMSAALLSLVLSASGATYTVTTTANGGAGSLRRAIADANSHVGPDRITFAKALRGSTIVLSTALPRLKDNGTTIDGDLNDDGKPDIGVCGTFEDDPVFCIKGDNCTLTGLAVTGFNSAAIVIMQASYCSIVGCHVGVNLAGSGVWGLGCIGLLWADHCTIGGPTASERNVLSAKAPPDEKQWGAIVLFDSSANNIIGNHIGITRGGGNTLGTDGTGVLLCSVGGVCSQNQIGGSAPGEGNRFGGLTEGIVVTAFMANSTIAGNTFGLLANGNDPAPIQTAAIHFKAGLISSNTIGGTVGKARNVFANCTTGIAMEGDGTEDNRIQGNWFGCNASGKSARRLINGIVLSNSAGRQIIGGNKAACRNYFTPNAVPNDDTIGIVVSAGNDTVIRNNTFGRLPNGDVVASSRGIGVLNTKVSITDNRFDNASTGISLGGASTNAGIYRNHFERCGTGVEIVANATCCLGDLGNADSRDDGGNVFRYPSLLLCPFCYALRNLTPGSIKAEGNDWGGTTKAAINKRIWDKLDDPALGLVDYDPIQGGIHPTGATLQVTAAVARSTHAGAEIAFTLSAPAQVSVTILNLAGRVVARPVCDRPCSPGFQRVLWDGRSVTALSVPPGRYLARIEARTNTGAQAAALCSLYHR